MDMFGTLIALVLAIPVLAVISIVMTMNTRQRLNRLEGRLARLEGWLAERASEVLAPEPAPGTVPETLPAAAKESVITCSGRCQKVSHTVWPSRT